MLGPTVIPLFAVVKADGSIKRSARSNHLMIYTTERQARTQANDPGDTVVPTEVDLNRQPLFIREKVLDG